MAGPRFCNVDDLPIVNRFDKPVSLEGAEPVEPNVADCCSDCAAFNQCLRRLPLKLDLNGFNVLEFLNTIRFKSSAATHADQGVVGYAGGGADPIFQGTYLALPASRGWEDRSDGVSFFPVDVDRDDLNSDPLPQLCAGDDAEGAYDGICGTHAGLGYRQLTTPDGDLSTVSRVYVDAWAGCCLNDDGDPVIRIYVYLFVIHEARNYNADCDAGDGDQFGNRWQFCCELLRSDDIPVTSVLTLADLVNVPLYPRVYEQYLDDVAAADPEPVDYLCEPPNNDCADCVEDPAPPDCWPTIAPIEPLQSTPETDNYGNFASVLLSSCDNPIECNVCPPADPPDRTKPRQRIEIDFETTGGCFMGFHAVVPDCLDVVEYYWSFGMTGDDVEHHVDITEDVTLVVVDARGCVYVVTKTVSCECVCDVCDITIGVEITDAGLPGGPGTGGDCVYNLKWITAGCDSDCDSCYWEVCLLKGISVDPECDCPTIVAEGCDEPETRCVTLACDDSFDFGAFDFLTSPYCFRVTQYDTACGCILQQFYYQIQDTLSFECGVEDPRICP